MKRMTFTLFVAMSFLLLFHGVAFSDWIDGQNGDYDKSALKEVAKRVKAVNAKGKEHPIVIFDLDHTLFDNRPRLLAIMQEFAATLPPEKKAAREKIRNLRIDQISYLLTDTLARIGVVDKEVIDLAKKNWNKTFFHNRSCNNDVPIRGGVEYVKKLYGEGAFIVYLTGRKAALELECTVENMKQWGYPIGVNKTQLIMKPDKIIHDTEYKKGVLKSIDLMGEVVACFENESKNLNAMAEAWPKAVHIFLDTDANPHDKAELVKTMRLIPDYLSCGEN